MLGRMGKQVFPRQGEGQRGDHAQKASSVEEPVGCCCLLENKDSGKHSHAVSGEGQLRARPALVVRGGVFPPKGNRNSDCQESLEKEDLGVESGLGEQAWDLGQWGQWGSLGGLLVVILSLYPSLSLSLLPPPLAGEEGKTSPLEKQPRNRLGVSENISHTWFCVFQTTMPSWDNFFNTLLESNTALV